MDAAFPIRSRAKDEVTSPDSSQAARTRLIRTPLDLVELRSAWDSASGENCLPMIQYAWVKHAAECLCGDGRLLVVCAGQSGRLGFAPLARKPGLTGRLESLGASQLFEPFDVACSDPPALALLGKAMARLKSPIILKRLAADSGLIASIESAVRGRGLVRKRPAPPHPWIPLDESWAAPESHLKSGRRSDLRRAKRIAESMGSVTFEVLAPTPAELGPLLEEAFAVGGHGWKARSGTALACDSQVTDFFRRYSVAASEAGTLRIAFFRIDGQAVAMQMAVENAGSYWLLKMEYDERYARCSPGNLLTAETIRYAARAGLRFYEFMGTVEPCTELWTNQVHETVDLFIYPYNVRGMEAWIRRQHDSSMRPDCPPVSVRGRDVEATESPG
jgi:CelD/BcsL family acetyltransferase involved in cellulose biosynthesis